MVINPTTSIRCARLTVISMLVTFVVFFVVPSSAKPWAIGALALGAVVLLVCLLGMWGSGPTTQRAPMTLAAVFAVGLVASMLYLRTLPDAAIPLGGVGAMLICLVGLAVTGLRLRSR